MCFLAGTGTPAIKLSQSRNMCWKSSPHQGCLQTSVDTARMRWPRRGDETTHPKRGSRSCTVPARRSARHWGPMAAGAGGAIPQRIGLSPQRWIGGLGDEQGRLKRQVHRGSCRAGFETPRAGRRRVGGLAVTTNRAALFRKASLRLRLARGASPRVRRGPGVPRALPVFGRAFSHTSGAKTRRENAGG